MTDRLHAWVGRYAEKDRYSPIGIAFHWVMAALVLFQLGWGFYSSWLPPGGDKLMSYQVHSAAGLPILVLAAGRLAWRIVVPGPVNDADRLGWQTQVAYATHYLFYVAFFGLPLSGWLMWSSIAEPGPLYQIGRASCRERV
jgi:cytochrome b561